MSRTARPSWSHSSVKGLMLRQNHLALFVDEFDQKRACSDREDHRDENESPYSTDNPLNPFAFCWRDIWGLRSQWRLYVINGSRSCVKQFSSDLTSIRFARKQEPQTNANKNFQLEWADDFCWMNRPIRTDKSVAKLNCKTFSWLRHLEPLACNIEPHISINT